MNTITEIPIRNYHIVHFGHVNHARYVELLEEARWRYLENNELLDPIHRIGAFHVVARIEIAYRHSSRIGDVLRVETRIDGRSDHRFWVRQQAFLRTSGKTAIEAIVTNVFIDPQGQRRPIDDDILNIWPDLARADYHGDQFTPGR